MRILIIFALFVSSQISYGQTIEKQIETIDSIDFFAHKLTGTWKFIGYYSNDKLMDKYSSKSTSRKTGFTTIKTMTDSGFVRNIYKKDSLIRIEKVDEIEIMKMRFNQTGFGSYDYCSQYSLVNGWMEFETCQPVPEIVLFNGQYKIRFTYMLGEDMVDFNIKNDTLDFEKEKYHERYVRFIYK